MKEKKIGYIYKQMRKFLIPLICNNIGNTKKVHWDHLTIQWHGDSISLESSTFVLNINSLAMQFLYLLRVKPIKTFRWLQMKNLLKLHFMFNYSEICFLMPFATFFLKTCPTNYHLNFCTHTNYPPKVRRK